MTMRDEKKEPHWIFKSRDWTSEFDLEGRPEELQAIAYQAEGRGEIVDGRWVPKESE